MKHIILPFVAVGLLAGSVTASLASSYERGHKQRIYAEKHEHEHARGELHRNLLRLRKDHHRYTHRDDDHEHGRRRKNRRSDD